MNKKLKFISLSILFLAFFTVSFLIYRQTQANVVKLEFQPLSDKENLLLSLTDNKVSTYKLKNLPKDKNYEITLMYEVYNNDEKIKEQPITSILHDNYEVVSDETIGLNFKDNKINFTLINDKGGYSTGNIVLDENSNNYSISSCLSKDITLDLGTEIYLYHAVKGDGHKLLELDNPLSYSQLNNVLQDNEQNVLIKLIFKEL